MTEFLTNLKAALRHMFIPAFDEPTEDEKAAVEADVAARTKWIRERRRDRGEQDEHQPRLGLVKRPLDEGQQVLGTCSPEATGGES